MTILAKHSRHHLAARPLQACEYLAALEFCRACGAEGVLTGAKIADLINGRITTGEVWAITSQAGWLGPDDHTNIKALCWQGANLMPVRVQPDQAKALARLIQAGGGRPASLVGPAEAVMAMWDYFKSVWHRPRQILDNQLLMEIAGPPLWPADLDVAVATAEQLELVVPAAVAMFTEELGFPPADPLGAYRAHVESLVRGGAAFIKLGKNGDSVCFKADLGAVLGNKAQVQGVWTHPDLRGLGVAKSGLAAVVQAANLRGIEAVSLYVNHFNHPAIAAYQAVGFRQIGRFATVMF